MSKEAKNNAKVGLTLKNVETLEKLIAQLDGLHSEISALAKKSPDNGVNKFKIKFINQVIHECNVFLDDKKPLADFTEFDFDELPTTSDVSFILAQYIGALEIIRSSNILNSHGAWYYVITDSDKQIQTNRPQKLEK